MTVQRTSDNPETPGKADEKIKMSDVTLAKTQYVGTKLYEVSDEDGAEPVSIRVPTKTAIRMKARGLTK